MSLYTEWRNLSDNHENQEAEVKFWEAYLQAEASIYNELLNNKQEVIEGKVMTAEEIITLAKLPSRQELLAKLAGALLGNITKLAVALDQVKDQKANA